MAYADVGGSPNARAYTLSISRSQVQATVGRHLRREYYGTNGQGCPAQTREFRSAHQNDAVYSNANMNVFSG